MMHRYFWFFFLLPTISLSQVEFRGTSSSLGNKVNSGYDEQAPVLNADGNTIYFTRSRHPENIGGKRDPGDIWYSTRDASGTWAPAKNAGLEWNNAGYNSVIGFFNNDNAVYLSGRYATEGNAYANPGISVSYRSGNRWTSPKPVDIKYFRQDSELFNASLSPDGQTIVLAIASYESRGTEDIYVSFRNTDGTFSDVQNLGSVINTPRQELSPWIGADNHTLFFAGNGHGGEGSFDLFMSKRLDDTWKNWTKPRSLGTTINSNGRELYFFLNPENQLAYFCTTLNSDGYGDIRSIIAVPSDSLIELQEELVTMPDTISGTHELSRIRIHGKMLNSLDTRPVSGVISILLLKDSVQLESESDPVTGNYSIEFPAADQVRIKLNARGFMIVEETIGLIDVPANQIERNYYLDPLEEGRTFRLDNVLFQQSTAVLMDSSYQQLDLVYDMLTANPDIYIELSGHTDNQGDSRKNLELSNERVKVVRQYLLSKGIPASRISGKGYGSLKPVASNATEATRKLNRRVEFTITGEKQ